MKPLDDTPHEVMVCGLIVIAIGFVLAFVIELSAVNESKPEPVPQVEVER